jgi:hypothetical protein
MAQLGHTDPAFTLRVYAHAMRRDDGDKERLKALVDGRDWAPMRTTGSQEGVTGVASRSPEKRNPHICEGSHRWARLVSNQRPLACETTTQPAELMGFRLQMATIRTPGGRVTVWLAVGSYDCV